MILYFSIQITAVIFDYCCFIILAYLSLAPPITANAIGKVIGASVAFIGHRYFTFRKSADKEYSHKLSLQGLKYLLTLPANIIISSLIITVLLMLQIAPSASKFISDVLTLVLFFFINKYLVFR